MKISKNLKEVLNCLGTEYSAKTIDGEVCAYRKINERYDIEISGCNYKRKPFYVYVWDIGRGEGIAARLVEQSGPIRGLEQLKNKVDYLTKAYAHHRE